MRLPEETEAAFPLSPSLTVTAIHGGEGFTVVPDLCDVAVDLRLTPRFGADDARALLAEQASAIDHEQESPSATRLEEHETWPPYRLDPSSPLADALIRAAQDHVDPSTEGRVCGPSNIGNLCAVHGVPATCGFGVEFEGLHAANECASIADVPAVYSAYRDAVRSLLR